MSEETLFDEVVRRAGGTSALASALGEDSVQTVSNWSRRGFPANKCKAIEGLTGISVQRLRPNDWRDYWPEAATTAHV